MRFFRPDYPAAGTNEASTQNGKLVCETSSSLWAEFLAPGKVNTLVECLNSLKVTANYLYIPKTKPSLDVDPLAGGPALCLYKLMPSLPLPREIYFLGETETQTEQETFSMSFDSHANQISGTTLRTPRFLVQLKFPLKRKLVSIQDLDIWFLTSVLSLFEEKGKIMASVVPDTLSESCFANDELFKDKKTERIRPVFWPNSF